MNHSNIAFHHIAVVVENTERSKSFYRSVLGLEEIERKTAGHSSNGGAWLKVGNHELHLQERAGHQEKTDQHFALITDDFDGIVKRAKSFGAAIQEAKLS